MMGREDVIAKLRELENHEGHSEEPHIAADKLLLRRLREVGEGKVADAYIALKNALGFEYY